MAILGLHYASQQYSLAEQDQTCLCGVCHNWSHDASWRSTQPASLVYVVLGFRKNLTLLLPVMPPRLSTAICLLPLEFSLSPVFQFCIEKSQTIDSAEMILSLGERVRVSISMHTYIRVHRGGREKSNRRKAEFATELEPCGFSFQSWEGEKAVLTDPLVTSCHIISTSESS